MLLIGAASKLSGASVRSIRHYEKMGLLPAIKRSGSYRIFNDEDIEVIKLIKQAQLLGFSLTELQQIFTLPTLQLWPHLLQQLKIKQTNIADQIKQLQQQQKQLSIYRDQISSCLNQQDDCTSSLMPS